MKSLEIIRRTIKIGVTDYGIDKNGNLKYNRTKTYPENTDPSCFELSDNTFYFVVADVEEITTNDNRVYSGNNTIANVYMGDSISIEEAMEQAPENREFRDAYNHGCERVAVREDGYMSVMKEDDVTYKEYCDQYKSEHAIEAQTKKKTL